MPGRIQAPVQTPGLSVELLEYSEPFIVELPVREIAALDGITEPAVRKRLKKAMRILENAMEVAS